MVANTLDDGSRVERQLDDAPFGRYEPSPLQARILRMTRRVPGSWLGRRAAMLLRRVALMSIRHPVDDVIYGQKMRLYPFNNVCEKRALFTPQFFDPVERAILSGCLKEESVFVDVGANIGLYSLFVAGLTPSVRVLAIEPQPDLFARLTYNVAQNETGRIKALCCALSDKEGEMTLFISEDNRGESSIKIMDERAGSGNAIRVPAKTLLGVARQEGLKRIDALKIDVEGAEDLVIAPFLRDAPEEMLPGLVILGNSRSRWQVDIVAMMEERGYHVLATPKSNIVLERGLVHRPEVLAEAAARAGARDWRR